MDTLESLLKRSAEGVRQNIIIFDVLLISQAKGQGIQLWKARNFI